MEKTLEEKLIVGAKIKLGEKYAASHYCEAGEIWTLIDGYFEYDNGLYCEDQHAPSIWDEEREEFSSIYHLFGNELDEFMDCEIIEP